MQEDLSIEAGTQIGSYVIEGSLGRGSEGSVLLGRDSLLGRYVALKTARSAVPGETRGVEEARIAARLEHPNIVRVYHAGRHKGVWFIVYEYVDDGSVHARVQRSGALPVGEALQLTAQAAAGLGYAHQERVIHRDIKPHNLLVNRHGQLKIADFGLALEQHWEGDARAQAVGTPAFVAPELWREGSASPASDVYSLGACLYFMLVGRVPFPLADLDQLKVAHLELTPKLPAHLPRGIGELLLAMLAKDPVHRPQSGAELLHELGAVTEAPRSYRCRRAASSVRPQAELEHPFAQADLERALLLTLEREGIEGECLDQVMRQLGEPAASASSTGLDAEAHAALVFADRAARWISVATCERFSFSSDAVRLLRHISRQTQLSWVQLAQASVLVAAAAQRRIVTSWAVLGAQARASVMSRIDDVPAEWRKPPGAWPPPEVFSLLCRLRAGVAEESRKERPAC